MNFRINWTIYHWCQASQSTSCPADVTTDQPCTLGALVLPVHYYINKIESVDALIVFSWSLRIVRYTHWPSSVTIWLRWRHLRAPEAKTELNLPESSRGSSPGRRISFPPPGELSQQLKNKYIYRGKGYGPYPALIEVISQIWRNFVVIFLEINFKLSHVTLF